MSDKTLTLIDTLADLRHRFGTLYIYPSGKRTVVEVKDVIKFLKNFPHAKAYKEFGLFYLRDEFSAVDVSCPLPEELVLKILEYERNGVIGS